MPVVPTLSNNQVATRPETPVRQRNVSALAEGLGAAAQGLAAVGERFEQERVRALNVELNALDVRARDARERLLYDPNDGILTRRGRAAFDADEEAARRWMAEMASIEADARDPELRQAFRQRAERIGSDIRSMALRHAAGEVEAVDAETTEALVGDELDVVARVPRETGRVQTALANAERLTRDRMERMGMPPEAIDRAVRGMRSGARVSQVNALLAADAIDEAEAVVQQYGEEMTPDDKAKVTRVVEDSGIRVRGQRATDALYAQFGQDERAALAAAREQYEGLMRDEVVTRLERRYADDRRLFKQELEDVSNRALTAVEQGQAVSDADRRWLVENGQERTLRALRTRQRQVALGLARESDLEVVDELEQMPNEEFIDVNLSEYAGALSERDYTAFRNRQGTLRQTGGRGGISRGMSDAALSRNLLDRARDLGLVSNRATTPAQAEKIPADRATMQVLRDEVAVRFEQQQSELGRDFLTDSEQEEIIRSVFDDRVLDTGGLLGRARIRPRALVPEDRVGDIEAAFHRDVARLKSQGVSREEALRQLREKGYPPSLLGEAP